MVFRLLLSSLLDAGKTSLPPSISVVCFVVKGPNTPVAELDAGAFSIVLVPNGAPKALFPKTDVVVLDLPSEGPPKERPPSDKGLVSVDIASTGDGVLSPWPNLAGVGEANALKPTPPLDDVVPPKAVGCAENDGWPNEGCPKTDELVCCPNAEPPNPTPG